MMIATWSSRVKDTVCRNGHFRMLSCSPAITCFPRYDTHVDGDYDNDVYALDDDHDHDVYAIDDDHDDNYADDDEEDDEPGTLM